MSLKKIIQTETGKALHFTTADLPLLIHGASKDGASLFTIAALADLFLQNNKILYFTAFPMARDEFLHQIEDTEDGNRPFDLINESETKEASGSQGVIVKSGDTDLFLKSVQNLHDIQERIILIKNIETILTKDVFEIIKNHPLLILSGDFDRCPFLNEITQSIEFKTQIFFSKPTSAVFNASIPATEQYVGYMIGQKTGLVSLDS